MTMTTICLAIPSGTSPANSLQSCSSAAEHSAELSPWRQELDGSTVSMVSSFSSCQMWQPRSPSAAFSRDGISTWLPSLSLDGPRTGHANRPWELHGSPTHTLSLSLSPPSVHIYAMCDCVICVWSTMEIEMTSNSIIKGKSTESYTETWWIWEYYDVQSGSLNRCHHATVHWASGGGLACFVAIGFLRHIAWRVVSTWAAGTDWWKEQGQDALLITTYLDENDEVIWSKDEVLYPLDVCI